MALRRRDRDPQQIHRLLGHRRYQQHYVTDHTAFVGDEYDAVLPDPAEFVGPGGRTQSLRAEADLVELKHSL
jgi:hypothetical protein